MSERLLVADSGSYGRFWGFTVKAKIRREVATMIRGFAVALFITLAAVGSAIPASADPLSGSYHVTSSGGVLNVPFNVSMTPCGEDCTRMVNVGGKVTVLRLQGDMWLGSLPYSYGSNDCNKVYTFNKDSLIGTSVDTCNGVTTDSHSIVLSKNG